MLRPIQKPQVAGRPPQMLVAIGCLLLTSPLMAQKTGGSEEAFFEKRIRPVLVERCFRCHSPQAKSLAANLRLDSLAGMRKGGDSGDVISAADDEKSLLLSAIEYDDLKMPPDGKLPATIIADFRKWVAGGAVAPSSFRTPAGKSNFSNPGDAEIDWTRARQHWAFRPLKIERPPSGPLSDRQSVPYANPIDAYVYRQLAQNGQQAVGEASRDELVRRLYLDLIGLPPTVAEIKAFTEDRVPNAYGRLIDRLLASPHYADRWGRHWLDVVRYADSNGADENHPYPYAWRYRNYVIDAFNRDTPYDEFLTEQLAGDLLPSSNDYEQTNRRLTATTFLALGIKIDAEKDQEKKRSDIIDEQLDTIGRAMLGMTIGCARCHDHKFDPIPTSDYYALSGILRSTDLMNRRLVSAKEDSLKQELADAKSQAIELARQETSRVLEAALKTPSKYISAAAKVNAWRRANLDDKVAERLSPVVRGANLQPIGDVSQRARFVLPGVWLDAESFVRGEAVIDKDRYGKGIGIVSDRGGGTTWVEYDFALPTAGIYQLEFRYAAANPRPGKLFVNGNVVHDQCMGETTGSWFPDGQKWHVEGRYQFNAGKNTLRFEVQPNMSHLDQLLIVRVGEYSKKQGGSSPAGLEAPAEIAQRESLDLGALNCWSDLLLHVPEQESANAEQLIARFREKDGPLADHKQARIYFSDAVEERLTQWNTQAAAMQKQLQSFMGLQVMSVAEGAIDDAAIFIRGNHRQSGAKVPRRFLTIVAGDEQEPYSKNQSGRLELARAIADARNPLTSRVIANRIWRWHFGRGLVATTDNFGLSGDEPSHPQLLDFLATYLIEHDWSVKSLQRLIVSSRIYRSSSQFSSRQAELDPSNRNLWRWQPRRLEAEVIRDSLLRVAGRLSHEMGGAPLQGVKTANPSPQDLEKNRQYYQASRRRTVYLPIVRTNVYKFLTLFDFPNPAAPKGDRDSTTVPTQALFLLNSSWVRELASALAAEVTSEHESMQQRIEQIYLRVFGRRPTAREVLQAQEFLGDDSDNWPALCHVVLISNEFLYLK